MRVVFSNRVDELVQALVEDLAAERRAAARLLSAATVVVPNNSVAELLRHRLALTTGVAAQLRFVLPSGLYATLAGTLSERPLLAGARLVGELLAALADAAESTAPETAALREYLGAGSDDAAARRLQLAERLGALFEEYALTRPTLLTEWLEGGGAGGEVAVWQAQLYRRVAHRGVLTLPELWRSGREARVPESAGALRWFLPEAMPSGLEQLLGGLDEAGGVALYALNPCREFWEDAEKRPRAEGGEDNVLLGRWGVAGRQLTSALCRMCGWSFEERFVDPVGDGALAEVQQDLLTRRTRRGARGGDESLRLLAAPSMTRELEAVACDIRQRLAQDATLLCNQVAVLVPDDAFTPYLGRLAAVFTAAEVPHAIAGVPLAASARVVGLVERLLGLPLGRYAREDVLAVACDPLLVDDFCGGRGDPRGGRGEGRLGRREAWARLADRLGVVRGADLADLAGSDVERDLLSWDQAVKRLVLGAFLREGDARPYAGGAQQLYLPAEGELDEVVTFAALVRALVGDSRALAERERPLAEHLARMRALVAHYVSVDFDGGGGVTGERAQADERQALQRVGDALDELHGFAVDARPVPYALAYLLARRRLLRLTSAVGQPLAAGVVVGRVSRLHALPFREVYVVGLDEGGFPRRRASDALDVRLGGAPGLGAGVIGIGDVDRWRFLGVLSGVEARLTLSYVARDGKSGDARPASPVCLDLMAAAGQSSEGQIVADERRADALARRFLPAAGLEAWADDAGERVRQRLESAPLELDLAALLPAMPEAPRRQLTQALALYAPSAAAAAEPAAPLELNLKALRDFLESPLQGAARHLLGLTQDDDDSDDVAARLEMARGRESVFLRETLYDAWAAGVRRGLACTPALVEAEYERHALLAELDGRMPTGELGRGARRRHLEVLREWAEALARVTANTAPRALRRVRVGAVADAGAADEPRLPPLCFELARPAQAPRAVVLVGRSEPMWIDDEGRAATLYLAPSRPSGPAARLKRAMRGYLDAALLAAVDAGEALAGRGAQHHTLLVARGDVYRFTHQRPSPQAARAWLATLVADLVEQRPAYALPCEVVFSWWQRPVGDLSAAIAAKHDDAFGPVRNPGRFPPPPEADARAWAERRLRPFWDATREEGS